MFSAILGSNSSTGAIIAHDGDDVKCACRDRNGSGKRFVIEVRVR